MADNGFRGLSLAPARAWLKNWFTPKRESEHSLVPPKEHIFVGGGDFEAIGAEFLNHFIAQGRLLPHERVLDIGCGIGRMAVPLTRYLNEHGAYEGVDIVPLGIDWCSGHITPLHGNFKFRLLDVYNRMYNPQGKQQASELRLPYEDASFDFVFLASVFTHMFPADVARYVSEIARVLKPGGRCFATFFLLNDEALAALAAGHSSLDLRFQHEGYRTVSEEVPEGAIALPEQDVLGWFAANRLNVDLPVRYGSWVQRPASLSYQDILVATKG